MLLRSGQEEVACDDMAHSSGHMLGWLAALVKRHLTW
jgi:hypothetical protein